MFSSPGLLAASTALAGQPSFSSSDSHSLQMPQANLGTGTAEFAYVTAANVTETLFGTAQALIVTIDIPWDTWGQSQDETHYILGNDWRATPLGGGFSLSVNGPREDAAARAITFRISNQASTETRTGTVTLNGKPRRLLVCVSSDGSDLDMRVYADGVANGALAWNAGLSGFSGTTLDGPGFLIGCTGSGSGGALTPFGSGAERGFNGSVGFVGLYAGTVSNGDLSAISAGAAPESVLTTGANWLIGRVLTDFKATSFAAAPWATGDMRGAWSATGGFDPGGDLTPARDGAGNSFALDPIVDGTVWGLQPGQSTLSVPLSFTASGIAGGVEARLISAVDGAVLSDWATVAGVALGTTNTGTITWPICTSGWAYVEARPLTAPTLLQRSRARCAVGWVIAMHAQSDLTFASQSSTVSAIPSAVGNLSIATRFYTGSAGTNGAVIIDRITAAVPRNTYYAALANEVRRYGNTPVMIWDVARSGISHAVLQDDSQTDWEWSGCVGAYIARTSDRVSAHNVSRNASMKSDTLAHLRAYIEGDGAGVGYSVDHYLFDTADFFHGTNTGIAIPPQIFGKSPAGASLDYDKRWDDNVNNSRKKMNDYNFLVKSWAESRGWAFGTDKTDFETNGGHVEDIYAGGQDRLARRLLIDGLRACGVDTRDNPRFTGVAINGAGDEITCTFSLPNGGTLRTNGATTGSPTGADANPVQGFELVDPATGSYFPTRSGFTAEILDAAAGTVKLTKDSGSWAPGTLVNYAPGRGMDYGVDFFDHELWRGRLYESGPEENGLGLPVLCGDSWVVPLDPATALGARLYIDPNQLSDMIQERDGDFVNGTPVAVGGVVGSIRNRGTLGGYMAATSDAERPILRSRANWSFDDPYGSPDNGVHYRDRGPIYYLEFDHTTPCKMHFSGGPAMPDQANWALGIALALRDQAAPRRVVFQQLDGSGSHIQFMQNMSATGPSAANAGCALRYTGASALGTHGAISPTVTMSGDWPRAFIANMSAGAGASGIWYARKRVIDDSWTAGASVDQDVFRLGDGDWPGGTNAPGSFDLYGLFISGSTLNTTQLAQAFAWTNALKHTMPPLWI